MEFCTVYSLLHWASISICPLTLFFLSWHFFFSSRRADQRALRVPKHAMSIFLMMIPLATAWFDELSPVQELKSFDFGAKMMADQKRKDLKAISIREGPRHNQTVLLGVMWSVSGFVSLLSLAMDSNTNTREEIRRDYMVKIDDQSARETKVSRGGHCGL